MSIRPETQDDDVRGTATRKLTLETAAFGVRIRGVSAKEVDPLGRKPHSRDEMFSEEAREAPRIPGRDAQLVDVEHARPAERRPAPAAERDELPIDWNHRRSGREHERVLPAAAKKPREKPRGGSRGLPPARGDEDLHSNAVEPDELDSQLLDARPDHRIAESRDLARALFRV